MPEITDPRLLEQLNGAPPRQGGVQIKPADPTAPYKGPSAAAELERLMQTIRLQEEAAERERAKTKRDANTTDARGGVDSTESERTAAFLATRIAGGLSNLSAIGNLGAPSLKDALVGGTKIGNYSVDEARQRAIAAQTDMLDAALTLGTGAAYNKEQLEGYRSAYFAQPGDKTGTVADKAQRLKLLLEAAKLKAGASAGMIDEAIAKAGMFGPGQETDEPAAVVLPNGERGLAGGSVTDESGPQNAAAPSNYDDSLLSQGLSGLNKGVANTLGAPVDLANAALGLGASGINAIANTDLQVSDSPFLGSQWFSDRLGDIGSIRDERSRPEGQFVRRVGESVGSAALPVAGTAGTLAQFGKGLLPALGGGVGAATAQQAFPNNPWAELGGEILGTGATGLGMFGAGRRAGRRQIEAAVPSIDDLKQQASGLYQQAESRGVVAGPNVTANLSGRVGDIARDEKLVWPTGKVDPSYPRAGAAMDMLEAHSGQSIDPRQIQVMRDNLTDAVGATKGKERRIAKQMLDAFDEETGPLAPELSSARRIANRYLSAQTIDKAKELAKKDASKFTGSGYENALRTRFRQLDDRIIKGKEPGLSSDVVSQIQAVSSGTPMSNAARFAGRFSPQSILNYSVGSAAPVALGTALAGPMGGALAAGGVAGLGMFGRSLATKIATRNADLASIIARNGGRLPEPTILTPDMERLVAAGLLGQSSNYLGE